MPVRVLLVEDSEINRDLLRRRLVRRGFDVEVAVDGLAGMEMALELQPDVVLMDMSLPKLDGWQATSRLRATDYLKPIIGLTAHALSEDRRRALESGCDEFITKPVDFGHLVDSIEKLADSQERNTPEVVPRASRKRATPDPAALLAASLLATNAHALNNARMPLLLALESCGQQELTMAMLEEAEAAAAALSEEWFARAQKLHEIVHRRVSFDEIATAVGSHLDIEVGEVGEGFLEIDLEAFKAGIGVTLRASLQKGARVSVTTFSKGVLSWCRVNLSPIDPLIDPNLSPAAPLLARLHAQGSCEPGSQTVSFLLAIGNESQ